LSFKRRWWWVAGPIIIVAALLLSAVSTDSSLAEFLTALAWIWVFVSSSILVWKLWLWMTYRVAVRLFITYVLIGVLPLFFAASFGAIGLYIAMGQYTSVRVGSEFDRFGWTLVEDCEDVLDTATEQGVDRAFAYLDDLASDPPHPLSQVIWWARIGERTAAIGGEFEGLEFDWLPEGRSWVVARDKEITYSMMAHRNPNGDRVAALIPFDEHTGADLSSQWWFDIAFFGIGNAALDEAGVAEEEADDFKAHASRNGSFNFTIDGDQVSGDQIWPKWMDGGEGLFSEPYVVWFRVITDLVDFETGESLDRKHLALLRTSPRNVWQDFTLSRYELATELWGAVAALGLFFLVCYGLAMATAATMVLSITRSTSRLTAGARAIEQGDFDYRVPVKRRDQLGDLANTFNHMTGSVQSMLADVAEKERLARELELAREIQESLLPASHLDVGPASVRATFQPAAEVGGDYFDVFPISDDKLVVAIGDVAGHGLSTGLLMASLKSSVAALVHEGYSGQDLIHKVNRLLLGHGQARTMVTLTVVEIDHVEGRMILANAGHCPPLLVGTDGDSEELLASSLPMGSRLCKPASLERAFTPGSRLVLYSDGVVEAMSPDGEPFGYERLAEVVDEATDTSGSGFTNSILDAIAEHAAGVAAEDDLTILVVERNSST
jgi:HAMP domain-containing protein